MAELTERQWDVYDGIRNRKTPRQIAVDMGVTVSYVNHLRGELRDLGVIRHCGDLPAHGRYEDVYPWELVDDQPPSYKPALPPRAKLRLSYPQDSARDLTVPPVRQVWWGPWSVQGLTPARPDGKKPSEQLADQRVVLVTNLELGSQWVFPASSRDPWLESRTVGVLAQWSVTEETRRAMTLVIAAAIGVESVMDLTTDKEHHQ